jgi:hypothetical protein
LYLTEEENSTDTITNTRRKVQRGYRSYHCNSTIFLVSTGDDGPPTPTETAEKNSSQVANPRSRMGSMPEGINEPQ